MLQTILLIVHILVALALVGIILLQRSEGSGLVSSSAGSPGSFMTPRGRAQGITRATAFLAALFIGTSLALAILAGNHGQNNNVLDQLPATQAAPVQANKPPAVPIPSDGAKPSAPVRAPATGAPAVPLSK